MLRSRSETQHQSCAREPERDSLFRFLVFFSVRGSVSVSYTHLDVYKRQVLDGGRVAEQGKPSELMEREDSLFKKMVELQSSTGRILN